MKILLCDLLYGEIAMASIFCAVIVQNNIFKNCEGISALLICEANSSRQFFMAEYSSRQKMNNA